MDGFLPPAKTTHHWKIHDLYDPDSECQVDDHGDEEQQQEEVDASFPPAAQTRWVHGIAARPLQVQGLRREKELLLGDLGKKHRGAFMLAGSQRCSPSSQTWSHVVRGYYLTSTKWLYAVLFLKWRNNLQKKNKKKERREFVMLDDSLPQPGTSILSKWRKGHLFYMVIHDVSASSLKTTDPSKISNSAP